LITIYKRRVHDWLEKILFSLQKSMNGQIVDKKNEILLKEMKELILLKLTDLISINSEKTHKIISKYHKNSEKNVIKYLTAYPKLQIEYLERILNARENGEFIDNDLLLVHIELLCKEENETKVKTKK